MKINYFSSFIVGNKITSLIDLSFANSITNLSKPIPIPGESKILIENGISLDFCDVEVVNQPELLKRPKVNFFNEKINEIINRCNVQIDISISHIEKTAVATAIVKID